MVVKKYNFTFPKIYNNTHIKKMPPFLWNDPIPSLIMKPLPLDDAFPALHQVGSFIIAFHPIW